MLQRTIRQGQTWSDNGHLFDVVDRNVHEIIVEYHEDPEGEQTAYLEADLEEFTPV